MKSVGIGSSTGSSSGSAPLKGPKPSSEAPSGRADKGSTPAKKDGYTASGPEAAATPVGSLTSGLASAYTCRMDIGASPHSTVAVVSGCSDKAVRGLPIAPHDYATRATGMDTLSGRPIAESCKLEREVGRPGTEKFSGAGCTTERKKALQSGVRHTEASRAFSPAGPPPDLATLGPPKAPKGPPALASLPAPPAGAGEGMHHQRTGFIPGARHATTGHQVTLKGNQSDRELSGKTTDNSVPIERNCTAVDHYGIDKDLARTSRSLGFFGEGCTPAAESALADDILKRKQQEGLANAGDAPAGATEVLRSPMPTVAEHANLATANIRSEVGRPAEPGAWARLKGFFGFGE